MNTLEKEKLIVSWISLNKAEQGSDDYERNFWAFGKLYDLTKNDPSLCLDIVLSILDRESSRKIISNLAAGPVEDLLVYHGARFIEKIEELANKNAAFRDLLGGVWKSDMSDDIWKRVQAVSGPTW